MNSKLIEAREKRVWTQQEAANRIGIDVATLRRWEHGECKPRGDNKQRLLKAYDATAWELGLEGIGTMQSQSDAISIADSNLEARLLTLILRWPRNQLNYSELRRDFHQEIEDGMNNDIDRRRALKLMATLPITVFNLSPERQSMYVGEEIMPWITGGISACWSMGKGNDLLLASTLVSSYIPTLKGLTQQRQYRRVAAGLAAQAFLLKATLGWHLSTPQDALRYAHEAELYAIMSEDCILQVDALHRQGMACYYAKRYDQAALKLKEAEEIVRKQKIPRTQMRHIYLAQSAYQAASGDATESAKSLKFAQKFYNASSDDPIAEMLGYSTASDFLRWEGLGLAYRGEHDVALDSYEQVVDRRKTPIIKRCRVELYGNQLQSKLRMKDKDIEECASLWLNAINGAMEMQSEQRYNEAVALYETMQCIWPGEARLEELREHIKHW